MLDRPRSRRKTSRMPLVSPSTRLRRLGRERDQAAVLVDVRLAREPVALGAPAGARDELRPVARVREHLLAALVGHRLAVAAERDVVADVHERGAAAGDLAPVHECIGAERRAGRELARGVGEGDHGAVGAQRRTRVGEAPDIRLAAQRRRGWPAGARPSRRRRRTRPRGRWSRRRRGCSPVRRRPPSSRRRKSRRPVRIRQRSDYRAPSRSTGKRCRPRDRGARRTRPRPRCGRPPCRAGGLVVNATAVPSPDTETSSAPGATSATSPGAAAADGRQRRQRAREPPGSIRALWTSVSQVRAAAATLRGSGDAPSRPGVEHSDVVRHPMREVPWPRACTASPR